MTAVRATDLSKDYGSARGVFDLSFEVLDGEVFGFLGPNGAGKTTTIRLMLDLIRPTGGSLSIFGLDARRGAVRIRRDLGYLPGDLRLYEKFTARELLRHFAALREMKDLREAESLAERLDLELDVRIGTLSRGNRQKVGIVQAFMHRPRLLVLDEPTSGLDPLVQQEFHRLLKETTDDGRTVFLSSHVLSEVQHVADRVALVREGRLALLQSVEKLRTLAFTRVEASFSEAPEADAFTHIEGVEELERHGRTVIFSLTGPADPLVKALARHEVLGLDIHEADLEDVFLDLYRAGRFDGRAGATQRAEHDEREANVVMQGGRDAG